LAAREPGGANALAARGRDRREARDGTVVLRWVAVALVETSKTFRKLRGYVGMPKLVAALHAHDAAIIPPAVDCNVEAA
jgi:hypothetical protein